MCATLPGHLCAEGHGFGRLCLTLTLIPTLTLSLSQFFVLMDTRPGAPTTLGRLLDDYYSIRPFGGMVVPWVPFGSSGHVTRPKVRRRRTPVECTHRTWCSAGLGMQATLGAFSLEAQMQRRLASGRRPVMRVQLARSVSSRLAGGVAFGRCHGGGSGVQGADNASC